MLVKLIKLVSLRSMKKNEEISIFYPYELSQNFICLCPNCDKE